MLFIPGFLIAWATFPGVIIHEFAHKKACEYRNIPVRDIQYFSLAGGGHVTHRSPRRFSDTLAISAAPFAINTAIAFAFYTLAILLFEAPSMVSLPVPEQHTSLAALAVGWLAVSTGWHAIPSFTDTGNIWAGAKAEWRSSNLALFALPLAVLFYIGNLLAFVWFDAVYSIGIGALAYGVLTYGVL
ncbi:hypothetical protein [Halobacterium hubeiense]|uniref:hypothetical protein n=1 Tax=Halobacterium hubeiense TaxID=1407499 RepID=UPI003C744458